MDGKITVLDYDEAFGLTTFVVCGKLFIKASAGPDGGVAIHEVGQYTGDLKSSSGVTSNRKSFDDLMSEVKSRYGR